MACQGFVETSATADSSSSELNSESIRERIVKAGNRRQRRRLQRQRATRISNQMILRFMRRKRLMMRTAGATPGHYSPFF
jgi:predicted ATPase with chaperone activity